ncbi:MAG: hypothetical protein IJB90_02860 [Clostridia bacterium]|nr:hypothetical protein [Clostridia bacterium]
MDINAIIDKLNNELDKLNNLKKQSIDTSSFFTSNENFNDDFSFDDSEPTEEILEGTDNISSDNTSIIDSNIYEDIEPDNKTTSLVTVKERRLLAAQDMFKKSIRVSLKSFLISITLSFLNLFI